MPRLPHARDSPTSDDITIAYLRAHTQHSPGHTTLHTQQFHTALASRTATTLHFSSVCSEPQSKQSPKMCWRCVCAVRPDLRAWRWLMELFSCSSSDE
eukprot:3894571-Rhodomonas_salina.1